MTKDKIKKALANYQIFLEGRGVEPIRHEELYHPITENDKLSHCLYMAIEAQKFIEEDRVDKAMRWLCFVQGVLWSEQFITISELKKHNQP